MTLDFYLDFYGFSLFVIVTRYYLMTLDLYLDFTYNYSKITRKLPENYSKLLAIYLDFYLDFTYNYSKLLEKTCNQLWRMTKMILNRQRNNI